MGSRDEAAQLLEEKVFGSPGCRDHKSSQSSVDRAIRPVITARANSRYADYATVRNTFSPPSSAEASAPRSGVKPFTTALG